MPSPDPDDSNAESPDGGSSPGDTPSSNAPTGGAPAGDALDDPSPGDRSFTTRFEAGWKRANENLPLAAVPVVSSLLNVDAIRRVVAYDGGHFGVKFPLPMTIADLWTFVSLPNQGPGVHVSPTLWLLPVVVAVQSALVAGYLGSVRDLLEGAEYDFAANARRYFLPMLGWQVLVSVPTYALVGLGMAAGPLVLLLIPFYFVAAYLFYATPYLLVVADAGLGEAVSRSLEWGFSGGSYFSFAAGYLLFGVALSVVLSPFVVNLGAIGIVGGLALSAPVALALAFATVEFVAELAAPESSDSAAASQT